MTERPPSSGSDPDQRVYMKVVQLEFGEPAVIMDILANLINLMILESGKSGIGKA